MLQLSVSFLPKHQILLGYNHNVEDGIGEDESYRVHTVQIGIIFFIIQLIKLKKLD